MEQFGIEMRVIQKGGVNNRCNLSERIEEIGIRKGTVQIINKFLKKFTLEEVAEIIEMDVEQVKQLITIED